MLTTLSDSEKAVVETLTMRLKLRQALDYLRELGFEMSERTYYRHKKKIEESKLDRMRHIAKIGYEE